VTEQQLQGELGNIIGSANHPPRRGGKIWAIILIVLIIAGLLVWLGLNQDWFGSPSTNSNSLDGDISSLNSATPALESDAPSSAEEDTATVSNDLSTAAGRDASRRDRLNLFVSTARTAATKQVNLPISSGSVKLNDSTNPTVTEIRQLLADQGLTTTQMDEYLLDPTPSTYYFGYEYDGQLLTLTAVMEAGGTDCRPITTASGEICLLTKTVDL
jgi:hypothetical protein